MKELLKEEHREGKFLPKLTYLSKKLIFITGARAPSSDSIGESAGHGADSITNETTASEMTVNELIEQLQAVADRASSRSQSDPRPKTLRASRNSEPFTSTSRTQSDPIKIQNSEEKAVCIITGLGKVTRELPLQYNYCIQNRPINYSNPNILKHELLTL